MDKQLSLYILVFAFVLFFLFGIIKNSTGQLDRVRTALRSVYIISWIALILAVVYPYTGEKETGGSFLFLFMGLIGTQIAQVLQSFDNRLRSLESASKKHAQQEELI